MAESAPVAQSSGAPRWLVELVLLTAILAVDVALFQSLAGAYALDCDDTNLALAITRFDIVHFQPHPPGYLGYVVVLKLVHRVTGLPPVTVTRLVSQMFAVLVVLVIWRTALRLSPQNRSCALWAAAFVATSPILLYYGVDAQTHSAEAAMSALLLWALIDLDDRHPRLRAIGIGLILALGGSLRPSFGITAVGPVLWSLRKDVRALALAAVVAASGTLAWLLATVTLTQGGFATYRAASDSLMGSFVRMVSPLSTSALPRFAHDNLLNAAAWSAIALVPALAALAVAARSWRQLFASWPVRVLGLMAIPAVLFYSFVYCAEAGYLSGLLPPAALLAASLLSPDADAGRPRLTVVPASIVGAQLAFFLLAPNGSGLFTMMPTASEIVARESRMDALYRRLEANLSPADRILVVTDWPDPTALRQLPLLRPKSEVLQLPWQLRPSFQPVYSITLATDHDWTGLFPLPGHPPSFLRNRTSASTYDWILVDPRTSDRVRDELRAHSRCAIPRYDNEAQGRLRPDCFPNQLLLIGDFTFRFGGSS